MKMEMGRIKQQQEEGTRDVRRRKERTDKRKEVRRKRRMKKEGKVDGNIKERQQRKK